jgi:beta-phosphoglucomutase family hydrolase
VAGPDANAIDALLLDLDGVVTRTATVHASAWASLFDDVLADWAADHGEPFVPFDPVDEYLRYVDGRRRVDGVATFLRSRGVDLPVGSDEDPDAALTYTALGRRKDRYFLAELERRGVEVFPDAVALLDAARHAGMPVAVVSASENAAPILERVGLLDRFSVRVTGVEAKALSLPGKPEPDTFLHAARELHVSPERAAVVEDAISGVAAGRAGGFGLVVGVDRVGNAAGLHEAGADVVVQDLTQLATRLWPR